MAQIVYPKGFIGPLRPGIERVSETTRGGKVTSTVVKKLKTGQKKTAGQLIDEQREKIQQRAIDESNKLRILEEAKKREQTQQAAQSKAERQRELIQRKIAEIKRRGSQPKIRDTRDVKTGESRRIVEYERGSDKVRIVEEDGSVRYVEYGVPKGGGGQRRTKEVEFKKIKVEPKPEFTEKELSEVIKPREPGPEKIKTPFWKEHFIDRPRKVIETVKEKPGTVAYGVVTAPQEIIRGSAKGFSEVYQYIAPEEGITIERKVKGGNVTYIEPQFGTLTPEAPTGVKKVEIETPSFVSRTKIFERQRVKEAGQIGFELGAYAALPTYILAPGFIAEGSKTALDSSKTIAERALGAAEAGLGVGMITLAATKYLRTPVVKTRPLRKPIKPQAVEVQKQIEIAGKTRTVSVFDIRGELSPPVVRETTTKGRELYNILARKAERIVQVGGKPAKDLQRFGKLEFIPAKTFKITSPSAIISGEPFYAAQFKSGSKVAELIKVRGATTKISLKEIKQLPKTEQFLIKRFARDVTGREVTLEQAAKILNKEKQRFSSYVTSERVLKVRPKTSEFQVIPKGKRISRQIGVTESKVVVKTDAFDILEAKTLTKDVTKPLARATGKTPEVKTTIIKLKPKPKDLEPYGLQPAKIKKTPYTIQTQEVESAVSQIPLPKPKPVKPTTTILETPKPTVRAEIIPPSIYAGTGQYEITESVQIIKSPDMSFNGMSLIQEPRIEPSLKGEIITVDKMRPKEKQKVFLGMDLGKDLKGRQKPKEKQKLGVKQDLGLKSRQRSETKQEQELEQITETINILEPRPPTPIPRPSTPIPKPIIPPSKSLAKRLLKKVEEDGFEAFVLSKGKQVSIGRAKTQIGAEKILGKKLSGTLSASGFLEKGGKKIKAKKLKLLRTGEFRVSKLDPFKVVEKKERRLRKGTTGKEVQYFRKKGKSKKGLL